MTQNVYLAKALRVKKGQRFRGEKRFATAKQTGKKTYRGYETGTAKDRKIHKMDRENK